MNSTPLFTVIISCFNRGEHILPTLHSALAQTLNDFEILVICDGPDETIQYLPKNDARVRACILPAHTGSQSMPNNMGIELAKGKYIAYLGHDDIWSPHHLSDLFDCFTKNDCDVAVTGCVYYGPIGTDLRIVTGIFSHSSDTSNHFFPPSSFAHQRQLPIDKPYWRQPMEILHAVDADFLLRLINSGTSFASTQTISTHKFAAGHRYLSYLMPSSDEQIAFLDLINRGMINKDYEMATINQSKNAQTFMIASYPDVSKKQIGNSYRDNRFNKGIDGVIPANLNAEVRLPISSETRALDWYPSQINPLDGSNMRWSGPSLRPKLLIPFNGDLEAKISIHLSSFDPADAINNLEIIFNGISRSYSLDQSIPNIISITFIGHLKALESSIIEIILPRYFCPSEIGIEHDHRQLGILLMGITLSPVES